MGHESIFLLDRTQDEILQFIEVRHISRQNRFPIHAQSRQAHDLAGANGLEIGHDDYIGRNLKVMNGPSDRDFQPLAFRILGAHDFDPQARYP